MLARTVEVEHEVVALHQWLMLIAGACWSVIDDDLRSLSLVLGQSFYVRIELIILIDSWISLINT